MPQAIPVAAAAFANWAFAATGLAYGTAAHAIVTATLYYGAQAVLYTGVSMGLNAVAQSQMPNPATQQTTRKQTRPLRYVAFGGPSRMSGAYMLRESVGNKLGLVFGICEGRLASIDRIYLNDDRVTLNGAGWVQGMAGERYGSGDLVRISTRLGNPTETRHTILDPTFTSYWPSTARGDGIASLALFAQHRSQESVGRHFPNGEPMPSIVGTPVCFDWRDPTQSRADQTTWRACANPVVWLVHLEWFRFGRNWTRCIEPVLADLAAEANYCDVAVPLKAGGTEPRYRVAGNYPSNIQPQAIRSSILAAMDGWLSTNGKGHLILKVGRYQEPAFILPPENIKGYSWSAGERDEREINALTVSFVSPDHDYSEIEAGQWRDSAAIAKKGIERAEPLGLTTVFSRAQSMRLAKRKMSRLSAPRKGQVRADIYGLNGLGQRYIRVQNPEHPGMADVVCEVMNVEIDFAASQVVFDVIQADVNIDAWDPSEEEGEQPEPIDRPTPVPSDQEAARKPIARSVPYPTSATASTISIVAFDATLPDGTVVSIPAGSITGLTALTTYGVFWRATDGFSAEASPSTNHMTTGSWVFIGWQATSDGSGGYPTNPPPPGGWGGDNQFDRPESVEP